MKVNKNIWVGKNKPYNQNSLHFPDGITAGGGSTPTPPSGGESGGSNWRYFDTTKATVTEDSLVVISMLFQAFKNNYGDNLITILPKYSPLEEWDAKIVKAIATDFNLKIYNPTLTGFGDLKTIEEVFNTLGGVEALEEALGFTEITEEEFYKLE